MDSRPTGASGLPVLKLLGIKYFFTMLMDNRMKRLTTWPMTDDASYARRNQFTAYVLSDAFLCFEFTGREGEPTVGRMQKDMYAYDCINTWHFEGLAAEGDKRGIKRARFWNFRLVEELGRHLDRFLLPPNPDYKDWAKYEHDNWWYARDWFERSQDERDREKLLQLSGNPLDDMADKVFARPPVRDVKDEYPDADAEELPVLRCCGITG